MEITIAGLLFEKVPLFRPQFKLRTLVFPAWIICILGETLYFIYCKDRKTCVEVSSIHSQYCRFSHCPAVGSLSQGWQGGLACHTWSPAGVIVEITSQLLKVLYLHYIFTISSHDPQTCYSQQQYYQQLLLSISLQPTAHSPHDSLQEDAPTYLFYLAGVDSDRDSDRCQTEPARYESETKGIIQSKIDSQLW